MGGRSRKASTCILGGCNRLCARARARARARVCVCVFVSVVMGGCLVWSGVVYSVFMDAGLKSCCRSPGVLVED